MADYYAQLGIPNHGLVWTKGDMLKIKTALLKGRSWEEIGKILGRRPTACVDRYRMVRIAELLNSGGPDDTLITLRPKKKGLQAVEKK